MTTTLSQTVLSPWLTPVRLVSTSNIAGTYYNGPNNNGVGATLTIAASSLTVDSVVANVGDRILLQTQSTTYQQGIYIVQSISSTVVLQRAEDMQCIEQLKSGLYVSVGAGSVNAGNFYTLVEPLPNNIGVDAIVFNADPSAGGVSFSGGPSVANAPAIFSDTAGNIKPQTTTAGFGFGIAAATGNIVATTGNLVAGSSGNAGTITSFPATAANGSFIISALNAGANFTTTLRNSIMGQSSVISIPDPGAATAKVLLDTGTNATGTFTKLSLGATPIAVIDAGSSTITAAAGAANTATVTIQLKDGSGTNITYSAPFTVYASSASNGLTLASAASTGFSVASGGVSLANGTAVTTQIKGITSATGGCVLSLLDTGKQTSYLVLVVNDAIKISAQLSAGSYG